MHCHIVLSHPETQSYNHHLAETAMATLKANGWTVSLTDLYAMDFDPCERREHFTAWPEGQRFDVQAAQRHASDNQTIPSPVADEIARLDKADLVILQYPMWWHLPPAMLKGWFDRVLIFGGVYASSRRFEKGRFIGKRAMLSVTVGTSRDTYAYNGRSGDIDLLLWPVNFTLAYVGFTVLKPFVAYGVEAGLQYSSASVIADRLKDRTGEFVSCLHALDRAPEITFNRMTDWGSDGRIMDTAPVHSPFVRRRKTLDFD